MPERRPPTSECTMTSTSSRSGTTASTPSATTGAKSEVAALGRPPGAGRRAGGHAPEHLHPRAVARDHVARALGRAGQQVADHDRLGPGGDGLGHVAPRADAAVGDHRHVVRRAGLGAGHHGRELGHADAGDHPGGADRARSHADLDRVGAGRHQVARALGRGDVAGDDLGAAVDPLAHLADGPQRRLGVAVGDVEDEQVGAGRGQLPRPLPEVTAHPDGRAHGQAAPGVLGRVGALDALQQVLEGDQPDQPPGLVDQGQLLDARVAQQLGRGLDRGPGAAGHQALARGHDVPHRRGLVVAQHHVAVGEDAHRPALGVDHHQPAHAPAGHLRPRLAQGRALGQGVRVLDHQGLGALHPRHLGGLALDRQEAVDHPEAAQPGHGDGHAGLGDRVHVGRDDRAWPGAGGASGASSRRPRRASGCRCARARAARRRRRAPGGCRPRSARA